MRRMPTERLKTWLTSAALPFWAKRGMEAHFGWYEYLTPDRQPAVDAVRRFRVQARQIYTYALAARHGWFDGREIVARGFDFMLEKGLGRDSEPGFIHLLAPDYSVSNPKRDLYDHAFYLLACASVYGLTGNAAAKKTAKDIAAFLNKYLKSAHGGWRESIPESLPRRQNPHMHLFEAFMAWADVDDDPMWRVQADDVFALFEAHFFDPQHNIIREFFGADWSAYPGAKGEETEPGHAAEWVWLLRQYQRMSGVDTSAYANALYENLLSGSYAFQFDVEDLKGNPVRETQRMWVQTELIKAHLAQAEFGVIGAAEMAGALMDGFLRVYLRPDGTWVDQLNACGAVISDTIPTSSFYHIICMISEADRVTAKAG